MEKFDLENFPTSESAKKMLSYVSDGFYDESYVGKWIYLVMGIEYDAALEIVEGLPEQFFPETATWGLMYHEIKWGLPVRENLSYEERRRLIYQKRDSRAPMTPYRMENYLAEMTGFEVHVADVNDPGEYGFEAPHPNVFKVYFLGEASLDSKLVHEVLDRLKQSHTIYTVNERIEIELDNRNLEQIILRNIRFKLGISFWYDYVYDGTWLLDGSVILNTRRRYGLVLGLKYKFGGIYTQEKIRLLSVKFAARIKSEDSFRARIENRYGINFWDVRCFDGSWNLDGSELLDARRRYGLVFGMKYLFGGAQLQESVSLHSLEIKWEQHIQEITKLKTIFRFAADFWGIHCLDGSWPLDGEYLLDATRYKGRIALTLRTALDSSELEAVDNITVETKSRDYWFLDGAYMLDGSRSLNSIYRKEAVE